MTRDARYVPFFRRQSVQRRMSKVAGYIMLTVLSLCFISPFLWSFKSSFQTIDEVYKYPPTLKLTGLRLDNYKTVMTVLPFGRFILNSLLVATYSVFGQVLTASLVAYSFARLRWRGRDVWFVVMLSTMMLPAQVTMIPHYQIFRFLGWIDTLRPLIIPSFFGGGAFFIFLMRQFFKTIPVELEEAARLDGCSNLRIFWDIMLPLSGPAIATVCVLSFISHWQNFIGPLIYLNSFEKYTIAIGLSMFQDMYGGYPHYLLAASNIALLPVLTLFSVAQKYFVQGIVLTGLKE